MINKALALVSALLCCSLFANYSQYQRAVANEHKHIAENLKATINAYVSASKLTAKRQSVIDSEVIKAVANERDSLALIVKNKEDAIRKLMRLKNEKPFAANCRIDVERVRVINEKLSSSRRG